MSQEIHRIAILSDTHGLLRPEIVEILRTCEVILHGGDINSRKTLCALEQIAPVYVVRGNNDKEWAEGMAMLEVCEGTGQWRVEKIDLTKWEKRTENGKKTAALTKANLKQTVEAILKEMKSGRKVAAIADRLGIEQKFVEDVCRIYVTHPGVDAQGIVDRIEVNAL